MNKKQLARIADALEKIAANQVDLLGILKETTAKGNKDLSTHASMFSEMRQMIEPLLVSAVAKMEAKTASPDVKSEPALPPQPKIIERNGIRLAAGEPSQIEVDIP